MYTMTQSVESEKCCVKDFCCTFPAVFLAIGSAAGLGRDSDPDHLEFVPNVAWYCPFLTLYEPKQVNSIPSICCWQLLMH